MKYCKFISILIIILILHSCFLLENNLATGNDLIGVWYLESYERINENGNAITVNCPFDVYPYIAEYSEEYYYLNEGVYPESLIYEYYILIDDNDVHGYYKLDYSNIDPDIYGYNDNFSGLYYDIYNVDSYSIDSEGIVTTSRDYINGMSVEINGDYLTLSGEGLITLRRATESDIYGAIQITEEQSGHFLLIAYVALDNFFNSSENIVDAEIPDIDNILYRDMVTVPGGTFTQTVTPIEYFDDEMNTGGVDGIYFPSNEFQHTISEFKIGKYEVTYELWYTVYSWAINSGYTFSNVGREGSEGGYISYGGIYGSNEEISVEPTDALYEPVTSISWFDAIIWCNAYSIISGRTPVYENQNGEVIKSTSHIVSIIPQWENNGFRLPTEGEWQFAACGGSNGNSYIYAGSNILDDVAWYSGNSYSLGSTHMDYGTHNVGEKLPNELGLHDMSGNVHEICYDWYGVYPGDSFDYRGPSNGEYRVIRGGDWTTYNFNHSFCEVSYRVIFYPYNESSSGGFRVVHK